MEHKIGEKITLEVVETDTNECSGCFFDKIVSERCNAPCYGRDDHKSVIYKEIKEIGMTTEELLDLLPDSIYIPYDNPEDEFEKKRGYGFVLEKESGVYELSYYNFLYEEDLISYEGSLHEVANNMYEWCKEHGYC